VKLKVPKLKKITFESAIIERYKRREISVEEAMVEMYLAGVSVRRVEDITEALWGTKVSPGTISNLNKKIYEEIEKWRNLPLSEHYAYVYLDGIWMKRSWGGQVKNVSALVAIGVNEDGFREILGVSEGTKEDKESWVGFLRYLKKRGLKNINMIISDKSLGLVESIPDFYPKAKWQRCVVHYYRNVFSLVPHGRRKEVATMLKAIHAQENLEEATKKKDKIAEKLENMKLGKAAELVRSGSPETFSYYDFPVEHWKRI
jgi:putative transposase